MHEKELVELGAFEKLEFLTLFCFAGPGAPGQGGSPPSAMGPAPGPGESGFTLRARVAEVLTGSRYALDLAGRRSLVELDSAAAPRHDREFGREAAEYARERLLGKTVTLYVGRIEGDHALARVELDTGENLGLEMVRAGMAWAVPGCANPLYLEAQADARLARKGLWAGKNPVPPWEGAVEKGNDATSHRNPAEQYQGLIVVAVLAFLAWHFFKVSRQVRGRLEAKAAAPNPPPPAREKPLSRLAKVYFRKKFGREKPHTPEES